MRRRRPPPPPLETIVRQFRELDWTLVQVTTLLSPTGQRFGMLNQWLAWWQGVLLTKAEVVTQAQVAVSVYLLDDSRSFTQIEPLATALRARWKGTHHGSHVRPDPSGLARP
jgi:hypothetical protein